MSVPIWSNVKNPLDIGPRGEKQKSQPFISTHRSLKFEVNMSRAAARVVRGRYIERVCCSGEYAHDCVISWSTSDSIV